MWWYQYPLILYLEKIYKSEAEEDFSYEKIKSALYDNKMATLVTFSSLNCIIRININNYIYFKKVVIQ